MKRGTRVGQAYVAITADGSGVNDDIAGAFDDVDYEQIGRDGEGRYTKGWKNVRENIAAHFNGVEKDLGEKFDGLPGAIANSRAMRQGYDQIVARLFDEGKMKRLTEEVGRRAGVQFGTGFDHQINETVLDSVRNALDRAVKRDGGIDLSRLFDSQTGANGGVFSTLGPLMDEMVTSVERDMEGFWKRQEQSAAQNSRVVGQFLTQRERLVERSAEVETRLRETAARSEARLREQQQKLFERLERDSLRDTQRAEETRTKFVERFLSAKQKMVEGSNRTILKSDEALVKSQQRLLDSARREAEKRDADMWRVRNLTAKAHYSYLASLAKGSIDEQGNAVSRNRSESGGGRDLGATFGKLFGAGSRNNFLNVIGSSIGGVVGLLEKAGQSVGGFVTTFKTGMAEAGAEAGMFQRLMSGAGAAGSEALTGIISSGPGAVVAIGAVVLAASVLVSVLSALAAIVTALVATIASALVGAAAVAGAGLIALATAGGLVTAAFMSMTNAQKDVLKQSFQPLKAEMVGIGQLVLQDLVPSFHIWSQNLQQALLLLAPIAHVVGGALAQAGNILTASFSGPGFQAMSAALSVWLPSIIRNLSRTLGNFLNGTLGLFAALLPLVDRFAGYLAQVTARFSNWANSAKGRSAIEDFVNRAVNSLKSLWNATREVFGFITDLLFSRQAQDAGNSIFDGIARAFSRFRAALAKAIADGSLQRWFNNAIQFGTALWGVIKSLFKIFEFLDSSHVLDAVTASMSAFSGAINAVIWASKPLVALVDAIGGAFGRNTQSIADFNAQLGLTAQLSSMDSLASLLGQPLGMTPGQVTDAANSGGFTMPHFNTPDFTIPDLVSSGNNALNHTNQSMGGNIPDQYQNPYSAWAQQFIDSGPSVMKQIRQSFKKVSSEFYKAIEEASKAVGAKDARSLVAASIKSARDAGQAMVDSARSALSSAAQSLASATSQSDAAKALKEVNVLRGTLAAALHSQQRIQKAIRGLAKQKITKQSRIAALLDGEQVERATLADYAAARERLAKKIEVANQKLADAIALRKDYKNAIVDAVKSFGSLLTAQAQTIDGVEQALTAADITSNLQKRLDQIRSFQENLRKLLALGLNKDAYKQLLDGGVEAGGAFAAALVAGGSGAVSDVNHLTDQISSVAASLGVEASDRLYNAGIAAAQGVVDGLEQMSDRLDQWAKDLGNRLVQAIYDALTPKNPSGHGQGGGHHNGQGSGGQGPRVGADLVSRVSQSVAVSPEVAAYASRQGQAPNVSGNDPRFRDLIVQTPTANPKAVAQEVLNEVTGRL